MSFRFSLAQVLTYREQLEDKAKAELGRVLQNKQVEENHCQDLENQRLGQETTLMNLDIQNMGERWLIEGFIQALRYDIAVSLRKVANLEIMAKAAQTQVIHRAKDRRILEKLREKQEAIYKSEELQKEQREFDEIASIRYKAKTY